MLSFSFSLDFSSIVQRVTLRELNGHDELFVCGTGTRGALQLLNNIIACSDNSTTVAAEAIAISDRDFLLAAIYKFTYGSRIESSLPCTACGEQYDLNFSLDELLSHTRQNASTFQRDGDGFFFINDMHFRLPTGEDELAMEGLPADQTDRFLLQRCSKKSITDEMPPAIEELIEQAGPVLIVDLNPDCPECRQPQQVQFDMQSFLLSRFQNERKNVAAEVHSIAMAYGWSHKEILDLPRSLRKTYAALILN